MCDENKEKAKCDNDISEISTYHFDKNSFIVETEFNENSAETLSEILIRLMSG